jgi:nucleoside-diphosphate-sugar epimerase
MRLVERVNVDGSRRVAECAVAAGVPHLVYASSVGAYSAKPDDSRVGEDWPVDGVPTSYYSVHKAAVEHLLDDVEREHGIGITRLRPGLIFQREAGAQIARYFIGPFVPRPLLRPGRIPLLPWPRGLRIQGVHSDDVADAYVRAVMRRPGGAFNVAAEPVLDRDQLSAALHAAAPQLPRGLVSTVARLSWHARLQPVSPGWVHLAFNVPILDSGRARTELGWEPAHDATEAILELLSGMADGDGTGSPALRPGTRFAARLREDGLPGTRRLQ